MEHYISPFHFLEYVPNKSVWTPLELQRGRKQLLAEFELGSDTFTNFDKTTLLAWWEELTNDNLVFHRFVFENKAVLAFLEKEQVITQKWFIEGETPPPVLAWVAQKYGDLLAGAFRRKDKAALNTLAKMVLPNNAKYYKAYYGQTESQLKTFFLTFIEIVREANAKQSILAENASFFEKWTEAFNESFKGLPIFFKPHIQEIADRCVLLMKRIDEDYEKYKMGFGYQEKPLLGLLEKLNYFLLIAGLIVGKNLNREHEHFRFSAWQNEVYARKEMENSHEKQ